MITMEMKNTSMNNVVIIFVNRYHYDGHHERN